MPTGPLAWGSSPELRGGGLGWWDFGALTLPLVSAHSQMAAVRVTLGCTVLQGPRTGTSSATTWLPSWCSSVSWRADALLRPRLHKGIWNILNTEENVTPNPERRRAGAPHLPWPSGGDTPFAVTPPALRHWQPPSLGAQCCLVIYGAPVSSRTRGGEPEIMYFVLSLSFKGKSNALGKGINVCPMWIS